MKYTGVLYVWLLILEKTSGKSNELTANFNASCEIHQKNPGHETPPQALPMNGNTDWLYASKKEIQRWYDQGKKECEDFLENNKDTTTFRPIDAIAPFIDSGRIGGGGQSKCRGRDTLYALSGMIVWPFGPYSSCPTYSKCWFGLLTCGTPKMDYMRDQMKQNIEKTIINWQKKLPLPVVPEFDAWSIRSLVIQTRLVGVELVVPDIRYISLPSGKSKNTQEDVLIGQYHTTIPNDNEAQSLLEMKLYEFYPSELLGWSAEQRNLYMAQNYGVIYLGSSEGRCQQWTRCSMQNTCCGCVERSRVHNTPLKVMVMDDAAKCSAAVSAATNGKVKDIRATPLPLCKLHDSSTPGRWIQSSSYKLKERCNEQASNNHLFHEVLATGPIGRRKLVGKPLHLKPHSAPISHTVSHAKDLVSARLNAPPPRPVVKINSDTASAAASAAAAAANLAADESLSSGAEQPDSRQFPNSTKYSIAEWFSGDHCMLSGPTPEEQGLKYWFFAPYTCKYHFYSRSEIASCSKDIDVSFIHFQGDSMSRDLFSAVSQYVGVPMLKSDELKRLSNEKKQKLFEVHAKNGHLMLSEGYYWDYDYEVVRQVEQAPRPSVFVANNAFAHQQWHYYEFVKVENRSEYTYWKDLYPKTNLPLPRFRYYQNARELQGLRTPRFDGVYSSNVFRANSEYVRKLYAEFGFTELNEFIVTEGRWDDYIPGADGWHFGGTKKRMESVMLFNMICNDWQRERLQIKASAEK